MAQNYITDRTTGVSNRIDTLATVSEADSYRRSCSRLWRRIRTTHALATLAARRYPNRFGSRKSSHLPTAEPTRRPLSIPTTYRQGAEARRPAAQKGVTLEAVTPSESESGSRLPYLSRDGGGPDGSNSCQRHTITLSPA